VGNDDLLAIAFSALPKRCHGGSNHLVTVWPHVPVGAANVLGFLHRPGHARAGVCEGVAAQRTAPFPPNGENRPDTLPGVKFLEAGQAGAGERSRFLVARSRRADRPVRIPRSVRVRNRRRPAFRRQASGSTVPIIEVVIMEARSASAATSATADSSRPPIHRRMEPVPRSAGCGNRIPVRSPAANDSAGRDKQSPDDLAFLREFASRAQSPLGRVRDADTRNCAVRT